MHLRRRGIHLLGHETEVIGQRNWKPEEMPRIGGPKDLHSEREGMKKEKREWEKIPTERYPGSSSRCRLEQKDYTIPTKPLTTHQTPLERHDDYHELRLMEEEASYLLAYDLGLDPTIGLPTNHREPSSPFSRMYIPDLHMGEGSGISFRPACIITGEGGLIRHRGG